eukprot:Nitzschia sp. Nitz4//scaffold3_size479765//335905//339282//NITZ4_000140-RA/size479765-augustus-gene-1.577-mRNA-1//1//CDS//3329550878//2694//frame0
MTASSGYESQDEASRYLQLDDVAATAIPTTIIDEEFVHSNDAQIMRHTFRVYGSIYLVFFVMFCFLRKYFPKLYNVRGWVPELKCRLAVQKKYGFVDWAWKVFEVTDDELLHNCGMDALCFLRCLRLGTKLSLVGAMNAVWLIPVYLTAEESRETSRLSDPFVLMSLANLPIRSPRFVAPVVAIYIIVLSSIYLISKEYDWYIEYRHKHLAQRKPRNYAIYVSGIPPKYQSSYALADYFRQCTSWSSSVMEAHIAMDIPTLESKVTKRDKLVATIEHTVALEKKKGITHTHRRFNWTHGRDAVKKVETVNHYMQELETLNNQIALSSGHVSRSNHRMRKHLRRSSVELGQLNVSSRVLVRSNSEPTLVPEEATIPPVQIEEEEDYPRFTRPDVDDSDDSDGSLGTTIDNAIFGRGGGGLAKVAPNRSPPTPQKQQSDPSVYPLRRQLSDPSVAAASVAQSVAKSHYSQGNPSVYPLRRQLSDPSVAAQSVAKSHYSRAAMMEEGRAATDSAIELDADGEILSPNSSARRRFLLDWNVGETIRSNVGQGVRLIGDIGYQGAVLVGSGGAQAFSNVKKVGTIGVSGVRKAAETGFQNGVQLATTAVGVVPLRLSRADGKPREAGFVVFNDLYTAQAARQMLQHPHTNTMVVEPAPDPEEIFWRNVGLPAKAKRSGLLISLTATAVLCFFWSIPMAILSSFTEVNSLKEKLPVLENLIETFPAMEGALALLAPLLVLVINEVFLPVILKWFATWEGHVSASVLEASLFVKLCTFVFIQTFFVSAVSGTVTAEISNILNNPEDIVDLLANSLPAQSSYFIQICFVFTFLLQGLDLIRAYPLILAFLRRCCCGPKLTEKERKKTWSWFNSLEDPPEFWHAEILAQIMLFFVVFFVYATIAPITSLFLGFCFLICESGYRYHFVHNHHKTPDSGGRLWIGFINVLVASILIGEITLFGMLILKKTVYATSALAPLGVITVLFMVFTIPKRNQVANNLPTLLCVEHDKKNMDAKITAADFASKVYLQPALRAEPMFPETEDSREL